MKARIASFITTKRFLAISLTFLSIMGYGVIVFGAQLANGTPPPSGGYVTTNPILDPGCAPGSSDCVVTIPTLTGSTTGNAAWLGVGAGSGGASTDYTVFIGVNAGEGATNAGNSDFIGQGAGENATNANNSNFLGQDSGCNATNADNANFFGFESGCYATYANNSNFFGNQSGWYATNADHSTFLGDMSGYQASGADHANFMGANAGYQAYNASNANFLGFEAGQNADGANDSDFFGYQAGYNSTPGTTFAASDSDFIGNQAGKDAVNASDSIFMGPGSGFAAANAATSVFIGAKSGQNAANAQNSIFIGFGAGQNDSVDNTSGGSSILIGNGTNTGGFSNSIAIGAGATNTMANQFLVGAAYTDWNIAGVDYVWPTSQAASAGYVLTNDGSGNLSWQPASGGSGGGAGNPAGSNLDAQFNDNGSFGADTGTYTYDPSSTTLQVLKPGGITTHYGIIFLDLKITTNLNDLTASGTFSGAHAIVQIAAPAGDTEITYNNLDGALDNGSTVTGNTSGATGDIDWDNEADTIYLSSVVGTFQPGETITADTGDSATVSTVTLTTADNFFYDPVGLSQDAGEFQITGSRQSLPGGLNVTFTHTTGHDVGSRWVLTPGAQVSTPASGNILANTLELSNGTSQLSLVAPQTGGSNYSIIFPSTQGSAGQTLVNDGSGNLTWAAGGVAAAAGSTDDAQFNNNGVLDADTGTYTYDPSTTTLQVLGGTPANYTIQLLSHNGGLNDLTASGTFNGTKIMRVIALAGDTYLTYNNLSGALDNGSTVTGSSSGATADIVTDDETSQIWLTNVVGTFQPGETITADTGDSATVVSATVTTGDTFSDGGSIYLQMNGQSQPLGNGLNLRFASSTGHTIGTIWKVNGSGSVQGGDLLTNTLNLTSGSTQLSITPASGGSAYSLVLPSSQGSAGDTLVNDGQGNLSWAASGSGGGGGGIGNALIGQTSGIVSNPTPGSTSETWLGQGAGQYNGSTRTTVFIGANAGEFSTNADFSNFIGAAAGESASSASYSNFIGNGAGFADNNASYSTFIGTNAGGHDASYPYEGSQNAAHSIFIGTNAGYAVADSALDNVSTPGTSILIGDNTSTGGYSNSIALGANAVNTHTNQFLVGSAYTNWDIAGVNYAFPTSQASSGGTVLTNNGSGSLSWAVPNELIGSTSGITSTYTPGNTFETWLGNGTGSGGASTNYTVFIGVDAGAGATGALSSDFVGQNAGQNAVNAYSSNFFGVNSGNGAGDADYSNFFGGHAGENATQAYNSNFFGGSAGNGATNANGSNFFGGNAGQNAVNAYSSNFFGNYTGASASSSYDSNFFGPNSGFQATSAYQSNFLGYESGYQATTANNANFLGSQAGYTATGANNSNFMGPAAGENATGAHDSNFFGQQTGASATNADFSQFLGQEAGFQATNATFSEFLGTQAGNGATNASNSIFIGVSAGGGDTVNNTSNSGHSILIGDYSSTGGFSNSIAIGTQAVNTAANQIMIGANNNSADRINSLVFNGGVGNTCVINSSTGISCSSDERLKDNIVDLPSNTLDTLDKVRTVTYNWINTSIDTNQHIGFLAQDLQQYYPQVVSTNADGMMSVNYANMTPVLVESIRELNLKLTDIQAVANGVDPTFLDNLESWFADSTNTIGAFFADTINARQQICVDGECLTKSDVANLIQMEHSQYPSSGGGSDPSNPPASPTPGDSGSGTSSNPGSGTSSDPGTDGSGSGTVSDPGDNGSASGTDPAGPVTPPVTPSNPPSDPAAPPTPDPNPAPTATQ